MSILIKGVKLINRVVDVYLENKYITQVSDKIPIEADFKIDGKNKAILPSMMNAHTHSPMTLLRGYADDIDLNTWLKEKIWPIEAKLTEDDVYWGSKLAILEMIKTGTTFFVDMYHHFNGIARAVEDMGVRAHISTGIMDEFKEDKSKEQIQISKKAFESANNFSERVSFMLGPHSVNTVSKETLEWVRDFSQEKNIKVQMHLGESYDETKECVARTKLRPIEYLDKIGVLSPQFQAVHAIWVKENELDLIRQSGTSVVHCPVSTMKIPVGNVFPYEEYMSRGIPVVLGTDGAATNNSLDMFQEMKIASLVQKMHMNSKITMPASEVFSIATKETAKVFDLKAGEVKEGNLADIILVDLKHHSMVPDHNIISNLVYSASGDAVTSTICNGKILMHERKIEGEEEIIEKAKNLSQEILIR